MNNELQAHSKPDDSQQKLIVYIVNQLKNKVPSSTNETDAQYRRIAFFETSEITINYKLSVLHQLLKSNTLKFSLESTLEKLLETFPKISTDIFDSLNSNKQITPAEHKILLSDILGLSIVALNHYIRLWGSNADYHDPIRYTHNILEFLNTQKYPIYFRLIFLKTVFSSENDHIWSLQNSIITQFQIIINDFTVSKDSILSNLNKLISLYISGKINKHALKDLHEGSIARKKVADMEARANRKILTLAEHLEKVMLLTKPFDNKKWEDVTKSFKSPLSRSNSLNLSNVKAMLKETHNSATGVESSPSGEERYRRYSSASNLLQNSFRKSTISEEKEPEDEKILTNQKQPG